MPQWVWLHGAHTPMHFEQSTNYMFFAMDVFQGHIILLKLLVLTVMEIAHGKSGVILVWKGFFFFSEDGVTAVCY